MDEAAIKNQRTYKYVLIIMVIIGTGLLGALIYLFFYLHSSPDSMWHILPPSISMIIYIFIIKGIAKRLAKQSITIIGNQDICFCKNIRNQRHRHNY